MSYPSAQQVNTRTPTGRRSIRLATVGEFGTHLRLGLLFSGAVAWLAFTRSVPEFSILALDLLFCVYLARVLRSDHGALLVLHPFILLITSHLFMTPFLDAGDGRAYADVTRQYFESNDLSFFNTNLINDFTLLGFFKYASLGILPIISLPEYIFGPLPDRMYYLWQGTLHVSLCCLVASLASSWRTFDKGTLAVISLFTVLSPSMFDLGATPTRHVLTFFGVFLLFVAHISLYRQVTLSRVCWYCIAIATVIVSKAPLLLPYSLFALLDLTLIQRKISKTTIVLLAGIAIGAATIGSDLVATAVDYIETISRSGAGTFGALANAPVIGWVVKYVYDLLAPFPWLKATYFIETNYSGNYLLFIAHILSSLTGLYLFLVVAIHGRQIIRSDDTRLQQIIAFALVMSTSILGGSTGFHVYLLIYFPMMAPLFLRRELRINPLLPLYVIIPLEAFLLVMG